MKSMFDCQHLLRPFAHLFLVPVFLAAALFLGVDACQVPDDCSDEVDTLAKEMYAAPQACTAVVRLNYTTYDILGYQLICGRYNYIDEKQARLTAQNDTGYGLNGQMLNPSAPEDVFVFYESPGDFGGVAAVSARTGLSLFGGSIVWMGTGEISYPMEWHPASELGQGCDPAGGIPVAYGYDLVKNGAPVGDAELDRVMSVIEGTAIPAAFWQGGYVFEAVLILYPRTVGAFNPDNAEWIVLVNGGWLE